MKWTWLIQAAAIAAAAAALLPAGCGEQPAGGGGPQASDSGVNVLLITLDTTRADRLGCYGHRKAETPALDALAARGLRFENAFTHVPLTLPSHASMLTGLRPPEHGLHDNGLGKLGPEPPHLAEILAKRGYRTAAFLASFVVDKQFGLGRGFAVYDDRMTPPASGSDNVFHYENPADVVADRALAWLEANAEQPFFCWVHFFDPHLPYAPPEPYKYRHADPYDGEIAFMDSQVKRLLDLLDRGGLRGRTLVIACGDHGEAFGEHEEHGHGPLVYETTMRVPMIVSLPGQIAERQVVQRVVGLCDVAPTVLGVLGWEAPDGMSGRSMLIEPGEARACYGESEYLFNMAGWARLRSLTTRRWRYIECPDPELYDRRADRQEQQNLLTAQPRVAAELRERLESAYAGMRKRQAVTIAPDAETLAALRALGYLGGVASRPTSARPDPRKDPKAMMHVYNACAEAGVLRKSGRHQEVIDLLKPLAAETPELTKVHEYLVDSYMALGQLEEAGRHIEAYLALDPGSRSMVANLGTVLLDRGKAAEAIRVFRHGLRMPRLPIEPITKDGKSKTAIKLRTNLGVALARGGKLEQAIRQFQLALADEPDDFRVHANLASAYSIQGKYPEAVRHYDAALKRAPGNASIHAGLAAALAHSGRRPEEIEHYRKAIQLDPTLEGAHNGLGSALCRQKQYGEAIRIWREGLRRHPGDPLLSQSLAWSLATCPQAEHRNGREAVRLAEGLCRGVGSDDPRALDVLAAAYAEAGQFAKAMANAGKAQALARAAGQTELADGLEQRIRLYTASRPYHQPP